MPRPKISPKPEREIKVKARLIAESLIEESKNGMIYAGDITSYTVSECSEWAKAEQNKVKRQVRLYLKTENQKITNKPTKIENSSNNKEGTLPDYSSIYFGTRNANDYKSLPRMSELESEMIFELYRNAKEEGNTKVAKKWLNMLVEAHMYLAAHVVEWISKYDDEKKQELLQDSYFLVCDSINKYDPSKPASLSTYITIRLRKKMLKYRGKDYYVGIEIPDYVANEIHKINKFIDQYVVEFGMYPTRSVIMDNFGYNEDKLDFYLQTAKISFSSLNADIKDNESTLADFVPDTVDVFTDYETAYLQDKVANCMRSKGITDRSIMIVKLHIGLIDGVEHSFNDIGRNYIARYNIKKGVPKPLSGECCRQAYEQALAVLGDSGDLRVLRDMLDD